MKSTASPYTKKDEPWSSHQVISEWLLALKPGQTGLDVGTATGMFGQLSRGSGLILDGIELQPEWAALAAPYYREMYGVSVENVPDDRLVNYDVLIFGDVLEHLAAPQAVLARLVRLQSENCIFLISVPNIANVWVRVNLLFGRFEYQDRGLLDRTHLRFFTLNTLKAMLQSVGLEVKELRVTPIPLPQVHKFFYANSLGRAAYAALHKVTVLFPRLLGYQFVVKAVKHRE